MITHSELPVPKNSCKNAFSSRWAQIKENCYLWFFIRRPLLTNLMKEVCRGLLIEKGKYSLGCTISLNVRRGMVMAGEAWGQNALRLNRGHTNR